MNRRSAVALGGTTLVSALSGCLSFEGAGHGTVTISKITFRNRLDRKVEASVLLVDDGEIAYWETVSVPTGSNPFATLEKLPNEAGAYELYAQIPGSDADPPVHADLTEDAGDQSCITVGIEVTTVRVDGENVPAIAYGSIGEC